MLSSVWVVVDGLSGELLASGAMGKETAEDLAASMRVHGGRAEARAERLEVWPDPTGRAEWEQLQLPTDLGYRPL